MLFSKMTNLAGPESNRQFLVFKSIKAKCTDRIHDSFVQIRFRKTKIASNKNRDTIPV